MTLERFIALPKLDEDKIDHTDGMSIDEIKREIIANEVVGNVLDDEVREHTKALAASQALKAKILRRREKLIEASQAADGDLT